MVVLRRATKTIIVLEYLRPNLSVCLHKSENPQQRKQKHNNYIEETGECILFQAPNILHTENSSKNALSTAITTVTATQSGKKFKYVP